LPPVRDQLAHQSVDVRTRHLGKAPLKEERKEMDTHVHLERPDRGGPSASDALALDDQIGDGLHGQRQ
jgi:hypothetical protein